MKGRVRRNYGYLPRTILEFPLPLIRGEVVIAFFKKMWQTYRFSQIYVLKIILNEPVGACMFVYLVICQTVFLKRVSLLQEWFLKVK